MNADKVMEEAKQAYWTTDGGDSDYAQALKKALRDMYLLATKKEYEGDL